MQEEERDKALAKVKKYQRELEEVEERADAAQNEADKLKSRLRTTRQSTSSVAEDANESIKVRASIQ